MKKVGETKKATIMMMKEMKKMNGTKEVARNVITDKVKKMIETKQVSR